MSVLSDVLVKINIMKISVETDRQMVSNCGNHGAVESKVQQIVTHPDITQEKWFWEKGVMS